MECSRGRPFIILFMAVLVCFMEICILVQGNCENWRSSPSGAIQSPNYPSAYPHEQKCTWFVSIEDSVVDIKVSFSSFNLQPKLDGECKDYVAIYRLLLNKDPRATLAGKFCGSSFPKSMRIAESSFTVQFVSDSGHETSNSYTGFSLYYEAYIKDNSISSQTIAGIVAAIFCAVLFTGVSMTRCFMTGACGNRNMQYADERTRERQFVGIDECNTFQADFPPSYSTVMSHPERYPTPQSSPPFFQRNGTAAGVSQMQIQDPPQRLFQSSDSENSDNDGDEISPPPPYPGNLEGRNQVGDGNAHDSMTEEQSDESHLHRGAENEMAIEETQGFSETPSTEVVVEHTYS